MLLRDSITLANLGGDFGVVGTEPAISFAKGISYGLECMYQQKLYKGFYGIIAYTFGNSEFENKNKIFLPSSWDSKHIINLSLGRQFKNPGKSVSTGDIKVAYHIPHLMTIQI